jgi:hypothetical protein
VDQPEADGGDRRCPKHLWVQVDVPGLIDRKGSQVEIGGAGVIGLVNDDGVEGQEGRGHVRNPVGRPDPGSGPASTLLGVESVNRVQLHLDARFA